MVRAGLLELQRRLATAPENRGAVLEGRDIGTVVFPDADAKFFVTASPEERARRRFAELLAKGDASTFEQVLADQRARDRADSEREIAPLRPAADALVIDTSGTPIDAVVDRLRPRGGGAAREVPRLMDPERQYGARECGSCRLWRPILEDARGPTGPCRLHVRTGDFPGTAPACDRRLARDEAVPQRAPPEPTPPPRRHRRAPRAGRSSARAPSAPVANPTPIPEEILDMTREELADLLRELIREEAAPVAIAGKWEGGTVVLKPHDPALQAKEIPIDGLLHKVVMIRDRLRVLEAEAERPREALRRRQGRAAGVRHEVLRVAHDLQRPLPRREGSLRGREGRSGSVGCPATRRWVSEGLDSRWK